MTLPRANSAAPSISTPEPVPRLLRDLIQERTGVFFDDDRLDLMLDKLQPRVAELQCPSYLDYYYLLRYDDAPAEWRRVMDIFSVQETYFWREFDQVRALVEDIVPRWFQQNDRPLRIWSAACATGEEPYSIVMALHEAGWGNHPIEVIGSDASDRALARASAAVYRERSFRALSPDLRRAYFTPHAEGEALRRDIVLKVTLRWANLVDPASYPDLKDVPVIFCRNVFIYFSDASIRKVLAAFSRLMPPDGHLFVGASESLLKLTNDFNLHDVRGAFAYVRQPSH